MMPTYASNTIRSKGRAPSLADLPEEVARYREAVKRDNCGFETVSICRHNIFGYLKFNMFADPAKEVL